MTSPSGSGYVIENCQTLERYNVVFDTTASVADGTVFRTNYPNQNTCYSVISQLNDFEDWDLVNLPIQQTFLDCDICIGGVEPFSASFIVVGGGGAGGTFNGGGGGAGALVSGSFVINAINNYTITIGAGGPGPTSTPKNNQNNVFFFPIQEPYQRNGNTSKIVINSTDYTTSIGGGGGGTNIQSGSNGGSGGGAGGSQYLVQYRDTNFISGGLGTPGLGYKGADRVAQTDFYFNGSGGGGGAAGEGFNSWVNYPYGNAGGPGAVWLDGLYYAGGGGGAGANRGTFSPTLSSPGGIGGGGSGSYFWGSPISNDQRPEANSGGGAGGSGQINYLYSDTVNGASGVVKLRYEGPDIKIRGGFVSQSNGYIYHTFTNSSAMELSGSFTYPNGYVLEECTTGQVLKMAWDTTSSIELNKTLLIDTRELEGCFTISQSVALNPTEWDYINIPFTSYDTCDICITSSYAYTASIIINCLTNETASAFYYKNVDLQPGEVWSLAKSVNDVKCFTITNDKLLTNKYNLGFDPPTSSIDYLNEGYIGEGFFYDNLQPSPWTEPTKWDDCNTCITQSMFFAGAILVNCIDENDTIKISRENLRLSKEFPFIPQKTYKFGNLFPGCYTYSSSYNALPEEYDVILSDRTAEYSSCEDCMPTITGSLITDRLRLYWNANISASNEQWVETLGIEEVPLQPIGTKWIGEVATASINYVENLPSSSYYDFTGPEGPLTYNSEILMQPFRNPRWFSEQISAVMTHIFWIKPKKVSLDNQVLLANGEDFDVGGLVVLDGKLGYIDGASADPATTQTGSLSSLEIDKWQQVAFTYEGGPGPNTLTLYRNGQASTFLATANDWSGLYWLLGNNQNEAPYSGSMANYLVYDRVLTPTEIYSNYLYFSSSYTD